MTGPLHPQLAEDIGRLRRLVLALKLDRKLLLGIEARTDEHELRAFIIEEPQVLGGEAATTELPLQRLRIRSFAR
jgi:hypothetical protein